MNKLFIETITLATPRGRLVFVSLATTVLWFVPFTGLSNLSLWQSIGWDWAPSIGLTRAYWLFIHGKVSESIDFNPLVVPVLLVAALIIGKDMYALWTNRQQLIYTETKSSKEG